MFNYNENKIERRHKGRGSTKGKMKNIKAHVNLKHRTHTYIYYSILHYIDRIERILDKYFIVISRSWFDGSTD